jgi:hypothetical protein
MKIILTILLFAAIHFAQDDCIQSHKSTKEFYDSLGLLPVKISSVNKETNAVYWKFEDRFQVILGSFKLIPTGNYDRNFEADNATYIALYCKTHLDLFQLVRFDTKKKK